MSVSEIQSGWELADKAGDADLAQPLQESYPFPLSRCQRLFHIQNSGIGISIKFINWSRYVHLTRGGTLLGYGGSGLDFVEGRREYQVPRVLGSPDLPRSGKRVP